MDFLVNPPGVAGNALFTARGGDPTVVIQAQEPLSNASLLTTNRQGNGDVHAPLTTVLALHAGNFIITDQAVLDEAVLLRFPSLNATQRLNTHYQSEGHNAFSAESYPAFSAEIAAARKGMSVNLAIPPACILAAADLEDAQSPLGWSISAGCQRICAAP